MTILAVEGPAGCGKTFRLMTTIEDELARNPLPAGARVLALTFMHGARARLEQRLSEIQNLEQRFDCLTIDSFAWRLRRRWRSLADALGLPPQVAGDFDAECNAAGALLERAEIAQWIANSYPLIVVDEAQDLRPQRLRIVAALARYCSVHIAADEFQCLDSTLRPNPAMQWLQEVCVPERLETIRRTQSAPLIEAAIAIRNGATPRSRGAFRLLAGIAVPMASATLASAISWGGDNSIAVITPSMQGGFARDVVGRVASMQCGKRRLGPYPVTWERSSTEQLNALGQSLPVVEQFDVRDARRALVALPQNAATRLTQIWLDDQEHVMGRADVSRAEILERLVHSQEIAQSFRRGSRRLSAMTVSQAKNREFGGVVVIWPYQVGGDDDHKRRLLYNAVTRAVNWCTVIVQGPTIPNRAPFQGELAAG